MSPAEHLRLERFQLEPGQEWSSASGEWRVIRLTKGQAYWLDKVEPRSLTEGELLVLSGRAEGTIRASQLGNVAMDWFRFNPDLLCGFFNLAERHLLDRDKANPIDPIQLLPSTHPVAQSMVVLLDRGSRSHPLIERGQVLLLALSVLAPALPVLGSSLDRAAPAQDRFQQIVSRMPDTELIQHSAEHLARLCGCTPRHFNRLFRQQFGQSPRAWRTELRLVKARSLLDSSDARIVQIAFQCGYRSLSLFNSLFKRRFGMMPSEWRQLSNTKESDITLTRCHTNDT